MMKVIFLLSFAVLAACGSQNVESEDQPSSLVAGVMHNLIVECTLEKLLKSNQDKSSSKVRDSLLHDCASQYMDNPKDTTYLMLARKVINAKEKIRTDTVKPINPLARNPYRESVTAHDTIVWDRMTQVYEETMYSDLDTCIQELKNLKAQVQSDTLLSAQAKPVYIDYLDFLINDAIFWNEMNQEGSVLDNTKK